MWSELTIARHGIEKESIRVTTEGLPSDKAHPPSLGSSLMHPHITTDFTEPQLEFTTDPKGSIRETLSQLEDLHVYTAGRIGNEILWPLSMPPRLPEREEDIKLAAYGDSPMGRRKTIYRMGLGHRYGRRMQTISGLHYNFSFDPALLRSIWRPERSAGLKEHISSIYCHVARNLKRRVYCLTYLFGASPAVDHSFIEDGLDRFKRHRRRTLYSELATSLRLSEIGYCSEVQSRLKIDFNTAAGFIDSLGRAVSTVNPDYVKFSRSRGDQLNPNYLQIANELYVPVRPKQTPCLDETLLDSLAKRGIGYLEIRSIDLDPYLPCGVDEHTIGFLHTALLDALLTESPPVTDLEESEIARNHSKVIWEGNRKGLEVTVDGRRRLFRDLGLRYCEDLLEVASRLDATTGTDFYTQSVDKQIAKLESRALTPSARVLADLLDNGKEHLELGLELAENHARLFNRSALSAKTRFALDIETKRSLESQRALDLGADCG